MASIESRLLDLVADVFGVDRDTLNPNMRSVDIDGWDSLGHVTFLSMLESTFDVTLADDVKDRISSLPDILKALKDQGIA